MKKKRPRRNTVLYKVYIHAQTQGDPGPTGIGILIFDNEGNQVFSYSSYLGILSFEESEYSALLSAVREIGNYAWDMVEFYSDREDMVQHINGIFNIKDIKLNRLKREFENLMGKKDYKLILIQPSENLPSRELAKKGLEKFLKRVDFQAPIRMQEHPPDKAGEQEHIQRSAGGVVFKKEGTKYKICIIAKKGKKVWALPKGRVNENETPEETAVREVLEETGHRAGIGTKLSEINYYFYWKENNTFYHKFVYFFLMPLIEENAGEKDQEADDVKWVTTGEAYKMLTYINEKEVMHTARKILDIMV